MFQVKVTRKGQRIVSRASIRRETTQEGNARKLMQVPSCRAHLSLVKADADDRLPEGVTINRDLIPGEAQFIHTPTNYPR